MLIAHAVSALAKYNPESREQVIYHAITEITRSVSLLGLQTRYFKPLLEKDQAYTRLIREVCLRAAAERGVVLRLPAKLIEQVRQAFDQGLETETVSCQGRFGFGTTEHAIKSSGSPKIKTSEAEPLTKTTSKKIMGGFGKQAFCFPNHASNAFYQRPEYAYAAQTREVPALHVAADSRAQVTSTATPPRLTSVLQWVREVCTGGVYLPSADRSRGGQELSSKDASECTCEGLLLDGTGALIHRMMGALKLLKISEQDRRTMPGERLHACDNDTYQKHEVIVSKKVPCFKPSFTIYVFKVIKFR